MSNLFNLLLAVRPSAQIPPVQMEIYSAPGAINGTIWDLPTVLLTVGITLAIVGLVSWISWTRVVDTIHVLRRGTGARDLFLKMRIKFDENMDADAYLRYVDRHEADFVSSSHPVKGQRVTLVMGSLPAFPDTDVTIKAQVVKVRSLGGLPEKFLIVARFGPLEQSVEQPLLAYIRSLITPARVYS